MATVNYSVPEDVKECFNETFAGQNKSRLIAKLMRRAVEEATSAERKIAAYERLLMLRGQGGAVGDDELGRVRKELRP